MEMTADNTLRGPRSTSNELERLRELKQQALDLASNHLQALDAFHLSRQVQPLGRTINGRRVVGGFSSSLPSDKDVQEGTVRASLASTAACVRSLLVCPELKPGQADFSGLVDHLVQRHENGELSTYGLDHMNPFTIGQLLPVLADMLGASPDPTLDALVTDAVSRLKLELANDGVAIPMKSEAEDPETRFSPHGYLTYWALLGIHAWDGHEGEVASPSLRWSETELYRQISLFQTGHDERSDAYQLGYNLLIQYRFNRLRLGDSLVELGLQTLFGAQLERGVWEKRDPIFRYGDHGEAYCFSFELLSSLLRELRNEWSLLVPCEEHLARAMEWASRNALRQHGLPLWRSAHLVEDKVPESWASAEVYSFLELYAAYLSWRIQTSSTGSSAASPVASLIRRRSTTCTSRRFAWPGRNPCFSATFYATACSNPFACRVRCRRTPLSAAPTPGARPDRESCSGHRAQGRPRMSKRWRTTWGGPSSSSTPACSPKRGCP